jgi:hypothetical protein
MQQPSTIDSFKNSANDFGNNISNRFNDASNSLSNGLQQVNQNINDKVNDFSSSSTVTAPTSFLDTNTIFAKFSFIILVVVAFIILFNLGIQLIGYMFSTSPNPYLINGQIAANTKTVITQDPKISGSITIPRSNNALTGIEFTWSVWISYGIATTTNTNPSYLNVFTKGDFSKSGTPNSFPSLNNAPGVYFGPSSATSIESNSLWILMDTIPEPASAAASGSAFSIDQQQDTLSTEYIEITNIPINKYFHLAIRCENKFIDVYINGTVVSHTNLINVPKQNYYNVIVGDPQFSNSFISNLRYFSTALSVIDINNIVTSGPNTKNANSQSLMPQYVPNYLSSLWYSSKIQ